MKTKFKASNIYKYEVLGFKRQLKEKLEVLKTETGKQKATLKTLEKIENVKSEMQTLKSIKIVSLEISIAIDWKKSNTWGNNPHAEARIYATDQNGKNHNEYFTASASGCGYDKLSSVIASALNDSEILKSFLLNKTRKLNSLSGQYHGTYALYDTYDLMGGCGLSPQRTLFEKLGCAFKHSETKMSDHIYITFKK